MKLEIANSIKRLRKEKGITQEQFAEALGVSFQSVSRWENGICYPDIELIPEIALYFNVTVDSIMSIDNYTYKKNAELIISKHKNMISNGKIKESIKYARSGMAEYPSNIEIAGCLFYSLFIYCHNSSLSHNDISEYDDEIVLLANRILRESNNIDTVLLTKSRLAFHHCKMGRKNEGRKLYEELPSVMLCKELRIWSSLEDKEKIPNAQDLVRKSYNLLSKAMWNLATDCSVSDEYAIKVFEKRFLLDELIYDDGFPNYTWDKALSHLELSKLYLKQSKNKEAIRELNSAFLYAVDFDSRPYKKDYQTVLLGKITKHRDDYISTDPRPLTVIMRDEWLKSSEFDVIRNSAEFDKITKDLSR